MFEKIISNLPYNPSLIKDLGFYARRIRKEESLRRLGLVFIVLAFFVQFFAVISPPSPSEAASTNDMINGGFSRISELVADCKSNLKQYQTIIKYYGLSCADLASGQTVSLVSTSYNKKLFSMGWNPQGSVNAVTHKPTDEQPANIPGVGTLYWRYLWSWDTGAYSTYEAVKVTSHLTGKTYFILYTCGNLVSIGVPIPYTPPAPKPAPTPAPTPAPAPKPAPCPYNSSIAKSSPQCKPCEESLSSTDTLACMQYSKTASDSTQSLSDANGKTVAAGDHITYTLTAYNSGKATIKNYQMSDDLSYVLDYATIISDDNGQLNSNDVISWPAVNVAPAASEVRHITVVVKSPIPQTPPSVSDPEYYDHIMTNYYGNTINIYLPKSPVTVVATTVSGLPNTGPGNSLIIAAAIVIVAGYFFARSRLLSIESGIAIRENNGGGI